MREETKQIKLVEEEKKYYTIKEFFKPFLDNKNCRVFPFQFNGSSTAGNKKRVARVSISVPREMCDTNLKDLDNWCLFAIAIPREVLIKYEENEKRKKGLKE